MVFTVGVIHVKTVATRVVPLADYYPLRHGPYDTTLSLALSLHTGKKI